MADRRNLRDKAKSAGKSVAGTLGEGISKLKQKATKLTEDPETGISISEVQGQYLVIDGDGNAEGPYDDKKQAAARAREMKREVEENSGNFATGFSQKVNETVKGSGETTESSEPNRVQQFATEFTEGVNQTVKGENTADETEEAENGGPSLSFMGRMENEDADDKAPQLSFMGSGGEDREQPELPFMGGSGGEDTGPSLGFMDGTGNDDQPTVPSLGMDANEDGGNPQMPGFGSMDGETGGPQMPQFGQPEDSDDEYKPPWMF